MKKLNYLLFILLIGFLIFQVKSLKAQDIYEKGNNLEMYNSFIGNCFSGFWKNNGQIIDQNGNFHRDVLYVFSSDKIKVALKKNSYSYELYETLPDNDQDLTYQSYRIDVRFIGGNENPEIISGGRSGDFNTYYSSLKGEGIKAYHYERVTYKNIYENIDLVFYVNEKTGIKYNFIVYPGGDVSDIKMKYCGSDNMNLLSDQKLQVNTPLGILDESIPDSYTIDSEGKKISDCNVKYKIKRNKISYITSGYDKHTTLVIDPVTDPHRLWGTYLGAS